MLRTRILTAAVLGSLLLAGLFLLPAAWTVLGFGAVFSIGGWEWAGFGALRGAARIGYAAIIAVLEVLAWRWTREPAHLAWLMGAACVWWVIALAWLTLAPARHRPWLALACGLPVLVPAFVALAGMQVTSSAFVRGPELVLSLVFLVIAADVGAYFVGRQFGRHKLAPRVSPGKTWEGAAGGLVLVALVAWAWAAYAGIAAGPFVAVAIVVGISSIIGDLTESMFKRASGLKDSGVLLPGHGGLLDRIDSVTAAAPLYVLMLGSGVIA
ncbi:MAG TPA: phosphatidate cytidylyltransferase [Steroidobacteraceae bacterium]|jgi:phosphatidate cytidylyltransferase|nr:phosphatidate cytidylyltransferase [Steroidobacteraceae bacterium]